MLILLWKETGWTSYQKGSFLLLLYALLDKVVDPSPHQFNPFFLSKVAPFWPYPRITFHQIDEGICNVNNFFFFTQNLQIILLEFVPELSFARFTFWIWFNLSHRAWMLNSFVKKRLLWNRGRLRAHWKPSLWRKWITLAVIVAHSLNKGKQILLETVDWQCDLLKRLISALGS
jgi:hypothetical protein